MINIKLQIFYQLLPLNRKVLPQKTTDCQGRPRTHKLMKVPLSINFMCAIFISYIHTKVHTFPAERKPTKLRSDVTFFIVAHRSVRYLSLLRLARVSKCVCVCVFPHSNSEAVLPTTATHIHTERAVLYSIRT